MEPIALRYEGEDAVRGLQNFFKDGVWDDAKMLELYHMRLLIERKLFMPEEWFDESHSEFRKQCGVPEGLEFKTKIQIASDLINKVIASGNFPAKWIGADGAFGEDKVFLDSIPEGYHYFATVPSHTSVWLEMPEVFIPDNSDHKGDESFQDLDLLQNLFLYQASRMMIVFPGRGSSLLRVQKGLFLLK